eukprot:TRINITY_DN5332_c0_g2_i3.p2 TRINITY_DN5332_c0_g2~~TRINITY_DN5332_c0_g2_i3.p2  ORF type:complete len:245 (-),score=64.94 TRINITY_DN5332_c0_g2_i3:15-749(-)
MPLMLVKVEMFVVQRSTWNGRKEVEDLNLEKTTNLKINEANVTIVANVDTSQGTATNPAEEVVVEEVEEEEIDLQEEEEDDRPEDTEVEAEVLEETHPVVLQEEMTQEETQEVHMTDRQGIAHQGIVHQETGPLVTDLVLPETDLPWQMVLHEIAHQEQDQLLQETEAPHLLPPSLQEIGHHHQEEEEADPPLQETTDHHEEDHLPQEPGVVLPRPDPDLLDTWTDKDMKSCVGSQYSSPPLNS